MVADSCNPIEVTRAAWEAVAHATQARCVNIELICSDALEHRRRIETRKSTVPGLMLPTWEDVTGREYHAWTRERIVIDTARNTEDECFDELLSKLNGLAA